MGRKPPRRNQKWLRALDMSRARAGRKGPDASTIIGQAMLENMADVLSALTGRWQRYDSRREPASRR